MSVIRTLSPAFALAAALVTALPAAAQEQAFLTADKSGDGSLTQTEFKTFVDTIAQSGKPIAAKIKASGRYGLAFGRIDKNKDGLVSVGELSSLK
jgi:Ca2+-binding EF-hand superfamily protein